MEWLLLGLGFVVVFAIKANQEVIIDAVVDIVSRILYK